MQTFNMVAVLPKTRSPRPVRKTVSSPDLSVTKKLTTVPNFRSLSCTRNKKRTTVFRSSRPDYIKGEELTTFKELGIKCIIDCRSKQEYLTSDGHHLLDLESQLYKVKFPRGRNYHHDEPVTVEPFLPKNPDFQVKADPAFKHYFVNFFTMHYVWKLFNTAPWYVRLFSLLCLLYDFIFQTGHKHFVRLFARTTLNSKGILGQYKDMIEYSQRGICAALKLLCIPGNLPALLNCAHGKDRTGIVSALVLYCLGQSPEYIANEYSLSAEGLAPITQRLRKEMVDRFHMSEDFMSAHAETMQQLFIYINERMVCQHTGKPITLHHVRRALHKIPDRCLKVCAQSLCTGKVLKCMQVCLHLHRYGSVDKYLDHIGFSDREQEMLRHNLLVCENKTMVIAECDEHCHS